MPRWGYSQDAYIWRGELGIPNPGSEKKEEAMSNCAFCGKPDAHYGVKTGVSAYLACLDCATWWGQSDKTREALEELRNRGKQ